MHPGLPTFPAADLARPVAGAHADPRSLAGLACLEHLPKEEVLGSPLEDEMPPGLLLDGRFRIAETIGRSAMATIYRAGDEAVDGSSVALKVSLRRIESDPMLHGRFEREARIGASLRGPGLLRFIETPGRKSRPYIAMEYVDGCTLSSVLHRTRPLPEAEALRIASVICEALKPLHERGVLHRDLKPGNIMVRRDLTLALIDYGLASEGASDDGMLASLTPVLGTPEYMAPEQVRNARNDARTDVYSVGVILYQMLTGSLPFESGDPWLSAQMRVTGDPAAPRSINPAITPEAEEIVLRALRRDPGERYASVASFQSELDAPGLVEVSGLSSRLVAPRTRLSIQGTPLLAGIVMGMGTLAALVLLFLFLARHR